MAPPLARNRRRNITFKGDNFERYGGDSIKMAQKNVFAWSAADKGADVHMQADPTKLELMHKQYAEKRDNFEANQREGILSKYGGQEHLEAPPKELLLAQTEHYVEYSQAGKVIKGQEKAKVVSRFEEDVYPGNHTSVWGSFWDKGRWGFACCHSFDPLSYCTGDAGKEANAVSLAPGRRFCAGSPDMFSPRDLGVPGVLPAKACPSSGSPGLTLGDGSTRPT